MSDIWYVLAASIAMIPLAHFAPRIRKTMSVTIPEVIERRFGKGSAIFSAVLNILALFCLTSSQVAASGGVISTLTGIPRNVCLFLAGLVIIVYTTLGGMIADQISDLVQFIIILVGLAIATPFVVHGCGGWDAVSAALPGEQLSFTKIGWVVIIGYIFNLHIQESPSSKRSERWRGMEIGLVVRTDSSPVRNQGDGGLITDTAS